MILLHFFWRWQRGLIWQGKDCQVSKEHVSFAVCREANRAASAAFVKR